MGIFRGQGGRLGDPIGSTGRFDGSSGDLLGISAFICDIGSNSVRRSGNQVEVEQEVLADVKMESTHLLRALRPTISY